MEKHTIKKEIEIDNSVSQVWKVLQSPEYIGQWQNEFCEGSQVEADWNVDGTVLYTDQAGNGLKGQVIVNEPNRFLKVEIVGNLKADIDNHDNSHPENWWIGCSDAYLLSEKDGHTTLSIESEVPSKKYFDEFLLSWDKALRKIKELAENVQ